MYLHLPLFAIRQTKGDVIPCGNGWRLGGQQHVDPPKGRVVVVDDTVMTGNSLRAIQRVVAQHFSQWLTAAVYVNPNAKKSPDIHAVDLAWPHLLEWNLFNSVLSPHVCVDFDGILCRDCKPGDDDDGPRYKDFIDNALPLYMPRKVPIPMIVTARIERYRKATQAWLARHRIQCQNLVMHPAKDVRERRKDDIAAYKAHHYSRWLKTHKGYVKPPLFVESEDSQAKRIAELSGGITLCPATESVYGV
jgi:hypothetical protein